MESLRKYFKLFFFIRMLEKQIYSVPSLGYEYIVLKTIACNRNKTNV